VQTRTPPINPSTDVIWGYTIATPRDPPSSAKEAKKFILLDILTSFPLINNTIPDLPGFNYKGIAKNIKINSTSY